ncbi:MAG: V-type ATP synthase subunit E family protein, partial [Bacillota bacterium]|nr:V-type ATP synthase subunit E family protein [Bacillota bacterium]
MADTNNKTNNFLTAIEKYAKEQREQIISEVEKFKAEELKKAEDEALNDAHKLILHKMAEMHTEITSELSKREYESHKELFEKRSGITDDIFKKAAAKLVDFTKTADYEKMLLNSAKEIADLFENNDCTVYIKEQDTA